jgi:hypothetical protein
VRAVEHDDETREAVFGHRHAPTTSVMAESSKRFSEAIVLLLKRMRAVASACDRQQDLPDLRTGAIRIAPFASRGMKSWQDRQMLLRSTKLYQLRRTVRRHGRACPGHPA